MPAQNALHEPETPTYRDSSTPAGAAEDALFRQLVASHQHRLYRFIVKHVGWGTDAEDLTQQAFVEAAQSFTTFRGESQLSTWLYRHDPQGRIVVEARISGGKLLVTLTDAAPPFNPLLVPEPDTSLALADRQIGGLGLMFVKRTADCFSYRLVRGPGGRPHNQVCFGKRLPKLMQGAAALRR